MDAAECVGRCPNVVNIMPGMINEALYYFAPKLILQICVGKWITILLQR